MPGEAASEFADARLMADDGDVPPAHVFLQFRQDARLRATGRERVDVDYGGPGIEARGDNLRRLTGPDERARQDDVDGHTEARQRARGFAKSRRAVFSQRPLGVVRPRVSASLGNAMANQIQLVGRRGHVSMRTTSWRRRGARMSRLSTGSLDRTRRARPPDGA